MKVWQAGPAASASRNVQETLNVLIRRLGFVAEDARRVLEQVLVPLWQVYPSAVLYQDAIVLQSRYGFSFYDALIIAAALEAGCAACTAKICNMANGLSN